ncbi:hypothetical protein E6C60_3882 [Paenibacillus algicola]|uniref:SLH domain-containing protein n=1 Tax=Paenibacillus algicola TaxID=2565926 RepID=A0A4P8XNW6_9BACL|nr:S-layer homology domain-containing protein [Paenibacillus algicola]QCT04587.1 hypothetical protein E6C60_3882 [Paenibacillus algicola]
MLKRLLSIMLTVVMAAGLMPPAFMESVKAAGTSFLFPQEYYNLASPPVSISEKLSLNGTLSGVSDSNISYDVYQITKTQDGNGNTVQKDIIDRREGITGNINASGQNIQVSEIQLFPGLNKIVFHGRQGSSTITDNPIYVEYRNGPSLYNLKAYLSQGSRDVELKENDSAVLIAPVATPFYGVDKADISITGSAPSAEKITVEVNGKIWSYNLSSYNNYEFIASPVSVNSGKNIVKLTVYNKNQKLETIREITFFNGRTTFYDVTALQKNASGSVLRESTDMTAGADFPIETTAGDPISAKGKVIVPVVNGTYPTSLTYTFSGGATGTGTIPLTFDPLSSPSNGYMIGEFVTSDVSSYTLDSRVTLSMRAGDTTGDAYVTLRDMNRPYVAEINYLNGYTSGMSNQRLLGLTGSTLDGATITSVPTAVEVLVVNGTGHNIQISRITDSKGNTLALSTYPQLYQDTVVKNINGRPTYLDRFILELTSLPANGYQKLTFRIDGPNGGDTKDAAVTLLYGPFVQFTSMVDEQMISVDTSNISSASDTVADALSRMSGTLNNVPNRSDIIYSGTGQTVYLYVNNVEVRLESDGSDGFRLAGGLTNQDLYNRFSTGQNTVRFVYRTTKNTYERTYKVNLLPLNVPTIPAKDTLGIIPFPYLGYNDRAPDQLDARFEKSGSIYKTEESRMNVYGTFDILNLGGNPTEVNNKFGTMTTADKQKYMLQIVSPKIDGSDQTYTWTLDHEFIVDNVSMNASNPVPGLTVYYHPDKKSFSFILRDQEIPADGTPKVYTMKVFNNGAGGPSASQRLEVIKITKPINVLRPVVGKRIVNQNFVEVIIASDQASEILIGKEKAEKFAYDIDYDGVIDYPNAFRILVKDLKPNKANEIDIVAVVGDDEVEQSISIQYVPVNIPGAQYMMEMKTSHKVFDNALSLTFQRGTSLIRRDYNIPEQLKNQVFTGHDILFAIGNSEDGVVNRYEFEGVPIDFDNMVATGRREFISNFQSRFVKSSPVFWIDPGIADRVATKSDYDPTTYGVDPYQFAGSGMRMFYDRIPEDELVPSKVGTLELSYDSSISVEAGKLITVFRYNPDIKKWENIGGVVDAKKHTIEVPFDRFGYYVVAKLGYSYQDIVDHPYAKDFAETLYAKGIMNAFDPTNEFGMSKYVSRGEFTTMIVKSLNLPLNYMGPKHFSELPSDPTLVNPDGLYDFRYIETAARAGIVRGTQPQYFDAANSIQRQDAAVIIAGALNMKLETDRDKIDKGLQKYFKDYAEINYYARPSVLAIAKKGFIQGSLVDSNDPSKGYMFNPKARTLRADAAIIVARVMVDLKKLPKM